MEEYKESPWGQIPIHWTISSVKEETDVVTDYVANGSFASLAENVKYKTEKDYAVLIRLVDYNNQFKGDFVYIDKKTENVNHCNCMNTIFCQFYTLFLMKKKNVSNNLYKLSDTFK